MTNPDYRALCAELLTIIPAHGTGDPNSPVIARARAALAHPEPVAPTDEELYELWEQEGYEADFQDCRRFYRGAIARWGTPANKTVPPTDEELMMEQIDA